MHAYPRMNKVVCKVINFKTDHLKIVRDLLFRSSSPCQVETSTTLQGDQHCDELHP